MGVWLAILERAKKLLDRGCMSQVSVEKGGGYYPLQWFILRRLLPIIVGRGDWLGNPANIKVENNSAVGYVGSFLTVHNPLSFVPKL